MALLTEAANYIKACFKRKWLSQLFQKMRKAAICIQRHVRAFLIKRRIIRTRMISYLQKQNLIMENIKLAENRALFGEASTHSRLFSGSFSLFIIN